MRTHRALKSESIAPPTEEIAAALLTLHPQETPLQDADRPLPEILQPRPVFEPFSPGQVSKAVAAFRRASDPGGSGLSPTQGRQLLNVPSTNADTELLGGLTKNGENSGCSVGSGVYSTLDYQCLSYNPQNVPNRVAAQR